ncbi:MAG: FAD:protein FMN transferase [Bacteroidota bacterium]
MKIKLGFFLILWASMQLVSGQDLKRYVFSEPHMGTQFRIVLFAEDSILAGKAVRAAFQKVADLNEILSDYLPDSELNKLARTAGTKQFISVSEDLWKVLERSVFFSRKSKGAFDISIGPLSRLWRRAMRKSAFPESDKLASAHEKVSYKYIRLRKKTKSVRLEKKGMRLDLGGIAKGYAVDQVKDVLQAHGIPVCLVDGGGDLALGEAPPEKEGWTVEVAAFTYPKDEAKEILILSDCAIASSGDTYQYLELNGIRYSHIVDPRSGLGISQRRMLTVISKDGMTADALASTLSVLGKSSDKKLKRKYKDSTIKTRFIEWGNTKDSF